MSAVCPQCGNKEFEEDTDGQMVCTNCSRIHTSKDNEKVLD